MRESNWVDKRGQLRLPPLLEGLMSAKKAVDSRAERLKGICSAINKGAFGGDNNDAVTWVGSSDTFDIERFPSGCADLDEALGGGWPKGRIMELYGPESGGKTTTALHAIAEYQKQYPDEDIALIDTEFAFDTVYANVIGVDTSYLLVHQPENGIQALNVMRELVRAGIGMIILDSVAALTTVEELTGDIGDQTMGAQARMMSQALRQLQSDIGKYRTTVFFTNQIREKIGVTYGDKTTTPAGRALKHYASVRVSIRRIGNIKEGDVVVSSKTKADVKKNKTAPPFKQAEFNITFGIGIDRVASILDTAISIGIIDKRGAWLSMDGDQLGQGRAKVLDMMRNEDELVVKIEAKLKDAKEQGVQPKKTEKPAIKRPKGGDKDDPDAIDSPEVEVEDV